MYTSVFLCLLFSSTLAQFGQNDGGAQNGFQAGPGFGENQSGGFEGNPNEGGSALIGGFGAVENEDQASSIGGFGADQNGDGATSIGGFEGNPNGNGATSVGGFGGVPNAGGSTSIGGFGDNPNGNGATSIGGFGANQNGDQASSIGGFGANQNGDGATSIGGFGGNSNGNGATSVGGFGGVPNAGGSTSIGGFGENPNKNGDTSIGGFGGNPINPNGDGSTSIGGFDGNTNGDAFGAGGENGDGFGSTTIGGFRNVGSSNSGSVDGFNNGGSIIPGIGNDGNELKYEVKGRLLCGLNGLQNVQVVLWDRYHQKDNFIYAEGVTDIIGGFTLQAKRSSTDGSTIAPYLTIYHDCDDASTPGLRKMTVQLPPQYTNTGSIVLKSFDIGTWNLETSFAGEEQENDNGQVNQPIGGFNNDQGKQRGHRHQHRGRYSNYDAVETTPNDNGRGGSQDTEDNPIEYKIYARGQNGETGKVEGFRGGIFAKFYV